MSAKRPAVLDAVVPDQWADVLESEPQCVESIPEGWDTTRMLADRRKWNIRRAREVLDRLFRKGEAERREIQTLGSNNAQFIYRRTRK